MEAGMIKTVEAIVILGMTKTTFAKRRKEGNRPFDTLVTYKAGKSYCFKREDIEALKFMLDKLPPTDMRNKTRRDRPADYDIQRRLGDEY